MKWPSFSLRRKKQTVIDHRVSDIELDLIYEHADKLNIDRFQYYTMLSLIKNYAKRHGESFPYYDPRTGTMEISSFKDPTTTRLCGSRSARTFDMVERVDKTMSIPVISNVIYRGITNIHLWYRCYLS